jgi:hypothetical protein
LLTLLSPIVYDGPNTTYTFANGSQKVVDTVAFIPRNKDFSKVTDGPSFFKAFCTGPDDVKPPPSSIAKPSTSLRASATSKASTTVKASTTLRASTSTKASASAKVSSSSKASTTSKTSYVGKRSAAASATPKPSPSLIGYPKPVFVQESKDVSGYYLNDTNYKDIAVLVLPGFSPSFNDPESELSAATLGFMDTQQLLRKFFADAVKQSKKKLVIDLRGNGGGIIDMGFELFKQLFPSVEPYGASRYRAHEAFHYYSALVADVALEGDDKDGKISMDWDDADYGIQSTFLWSNILDENLKAYKSYKDYYGPKTIHNDSFTSIRRYNVSDTSIPTQQTWAYHPIVFRYHRWPHNGR